MIRIVCKCQWLNKDNVMTSDGKYYGLINTYIQPSPMTLIVVDAIVMIALISTSVQFTLVPFK